MRSDRAGKLTLSRDFVAPLDWLNLVRQVFRKRVVPHVTGVFQYGSYTGAMDRYEYSRRNGTSL